MGQSTTLYLAGAGASVAVVDIDERRAKAVAQEVNDSGGKAIYLVADATVPAEADAIVENTIKAFQRLDVLINIVGAVSSFSPALDMTEETWNTDLRVNLSYVFFMSKAAAKAMAMIAQGRKGAIVTSWLNLTWARGHITSLGVCGPALN